MQLLPLLIPCLLQNLMFFPQVFSEEEWKIGYPRLAPPCENGIYCGGEVMHDVQTAEMFDDSKDFVDMKLRRPEHEINREYGALKKNGSVPERHVLRKFIDDNFEVANDLVNWTIPDYVQTPSVVGKIKDPTYRAWAVGLNDLWPRLAKKVVDDAKNHPELYSVIWVPNGFVVPGGRFRELYYWDTYWIVDGLMLCDMNATARGVIDNMVSMVDQFGYVPNGGRVYYLNRSQPPMLILTVLRYIETTGDFDYLYTVLPSLEVEFKFWMMNRMVTFVKDNKSYTMARYYAPSSGPRPESYEEDVIVSRKFNTSEEKENFFINMKSAAEAGWDFSGRWYINENGTNTGDLSDTQTPSIVPVDLNSIIQINAKTMCTWFEQMGNQSKADEYCEIADEFLNNIRDVMWRPDLGAWLDWDLKNHKHREYFFVSNLVPLWTESYDAPKKIVADLVLKYLRDNGVINSDNKMLYKGVPTSMVNTSQQWDFPNAWPSMQAFVIQGLEKTEHPLALRVAFGITDAWLRSTYKLFLNEFHMYEKYPVHESGDKKSKIAGGGEYTTQTGFGWTNGVVLELLAKHGNMLKYEES